MLHHFITKHIPAAVDLVKKLCQNIKTYKQELSASISKAQDALSVCHAYWMTLETACKEPFPMPYILDMLHRHDQFVAAS